MTIQSRVCRGRYQSLTRMLRLTGTMGGIITTRLDNLADLQNRPAACPTGVRNR